VGFKTKLSIAFVTLSLSAGFFLTPHYAVWQVKKAADERNAEQISSHVDFPALRASLKENFTRQILSKSDEQKASIGAAMAAAFVNPVIDSLLTPDNLALMMKGQKPNSGSAAGNVDKQTKTSFSYENFNQFVVRLEDKIGKSDPVELVFTRYQVLQWKLSAVRFKA
jgi:hypothetical protein